MLKVNLSHIAGSIKLDEGLNLYMYKDHLGNNTIGWGHNMANPIPRKAAEIILQNDIRIALNEVQKLCASKGLSWDTFPSEVQSVLIKMSFQLGYMKLKGFREMWRAVAVRDWPKMKVEMLDSKWAKKDTPDRAIRTAAELNEIIGEDKDD